jgi:DNA-binding FadR family transcriptional regulator
MQADIRLHNILFLMSNNERAENYINNLNDQWHRLRLAYTALQGRTEKSIIEHSRIVTSVLEGDAEKATNYMCDHLIRVREDLEKLIEKVILPFSNSGF